MTTSINLETDGVINNKKSKTRRQFRDENSLNKIIKLNHGQ